MANKKFYYQNRNRRAAKPDAAAQEAIAAQTSKYSSESLSMPISAMGVSDTTCELLAKYRIENAGDLVRRTEKEMYKVQGLNKKILFELKDALRANRMSFRAEEQKPDKSKPMPAKDGAREAEKVAADVKKSNAKPVRDQSNSQQRDSVRNSKFGLSDRRDSKQPAKPQPKAQKPEPVKKLTEPLPIGEWRKVLKGGKWGYSDGFKIVIPTMYDEIFAFKEGLASVELNEKCGYIDEQNNIVIPFDYDIAMSFSEGLACVAKGEKCGYINKNNEVIFNFEYDAATAFENGEAKIKKDGKWGTLTKDGSIIWI